jgi:hypothetical protein
MVGSPSIQITTPQFNFLLQVGAETVLVCQFQLRVIDRLSHCQMINCHDPFGGPPVACHAQLTKLGPFHRSFHQLTNANFCQECHSHGKVSNWLKLYSIQCHEQYMQLWPSQQSIQLSHWLPIYHPRWWYQIHPQPPYSQPSAVFGWAADSTYNCLKSPSFDCKICCLLTCHQLTWKHLQTVAIEQNEELQGLWEADIVQYTDTDVFVALDESEVDDSIYTSSCKTHYAKKWTSPSICKVAVCGIGHGTSPELDSQWMHDMDQD